MYLDSWEDFSRAAETLFQENPWRARLVIKYRHCEGKLVVKATDDRTWWQYRTDQLQDIKKLEKLNNTLMRIAVTKV
ncbi:signal recognition particle 9 kDa protein-like [Dysidea avara]|uniref:signal recognition particle 9 kDa protein-like n=1 Tax=Dysidea avara TaxID=196820 RepID=UPI00331EE646